MWCWRAGWRRSKALTPPTQRRLTPTIPAFSTPPALRGLARRPLRSARSARRDRNPGAARCGPARRRPVFQKEPRSDPHFASELAGNGAGEDVEILVGGEAAEPFRGRRAFGEEVPYAPPQLFVPGGRSCAGGSARPANCRSAPRSRSPPAGAERGRQALHTHGAVEEGRGSGHQEVEAGEADGIDLVEELA